MDPLSNGKPVGVGAQIGSRFPGETRAHHRMFAVAVRAQVDQAWRASLRRFEVRTRSVTSAISSDLQDRRDVQPGAAVATRSRVGATAAKVSSLFGFRGAHSAADRSNRGANVSKPVFGRNYA